MVVLTNAVPLTVAGLGTREGAAIILLSRYHTHILRSVASASAFLMFFMNTALPGIVGALVTPFFRPPTERPADGPTAEKTPSDSVARARQVSEGAAGL
jgi:hypothetical protein